MPEKSKNVQKDYRKIERAKVTPLTAEELAVKEAERKAAIEKFEAYGKSVMKMSTKQLKGELAREARKPSDTSLLTQAWATVLGSVFANTKPLGKMNPYLR